MSGCPNCGYFHPPDGVCLETIEPDQTIGEALEILHNRRNEVAGSSGLTEAQRERLEMLAEEAAEVVQACTKILRHGYGNYHPDQEDVHPLQRETNRDNLAKELMDLWTVYERMALAGDMDKINFYDTKKIWQKKLKWTRHQR